MDKAWKKFAKSGKIKDYLELEEWNNVGPECGEFIAQMQKRTHIKLTKL